LRKNSALEDIVLSINSLSLKEIGVKVKGRHILSARTPDFDPHRVPALV
jgi:hypothetical protein